LVLGNLNFWWRKWRNLLEYSGVFLKFPKWDVQNSSNWLFDRHVLKLPSYTWMDGGWTNSAEFWGAGCLTNILQTKVGRKVGQVLVLTSLKGYLVFTQVTCRGRWRSTRRWSPGHACWYFNFNPRDFECPNFGPSHCSLSWPYWQLMNPFGQVS
jgi:hypothetical protein